MASLVCWPRRSSWQLIPVFVPVLAAADNVNYDGLICTRNTAQGSLFVDNTSAAVSFF